MTAVEPRNWFEPAGEISLKNMVLAGIDKLGPLEPGTIISHSDITEWLGEPFPRRLGEFGERSYQPMGDVRMVLLKTQGVWLRSLQNTGYVVATPTEMVEDAERICYQGAIEKMTLGTLLLDAVDRRQVDHRRADLANFMEAEMRDDARVMRHKLQAQHRNSKRFGG